MNILYKTKNYISNKYIEKQIFEELLNENKKYLSPGNYKIISDGKTVIYLKDRKSSDFVDKNISHLRGKKTFLDNIKINIKKIISTFFTIKIRNNNKMQEIKGTVIMISRIDDFMIFDLNRNIVINSTKNKENFDLIKRAHIQFKDYFDMPIKYFDKNKKFYIEDYIEFKSYDLLSNEEKNKVLDNLFKAYVKYFRNYQQSKITNISLVELIEEYETVINNKKISNKIIDKLNKEKISRKNYPKIIQHGDMNFFNILISEKEMKIIDWDDYGNYIFFYDFFNIIYIESMFRGDDFYLNKYIDGVYSSYLETIFNIMGLNFHENLKKEYMIVFIMEKTLTNQSPLNIDKNHTSEFINNCNNLIKKIN